MKKMKMKKKNDEKENEIEKKKNKTNECRIKIDFLFFFPDFCAWKAVLLFLTGFVGGQLHFLLQDAISNLLLYAIS